MAAILDGGKLRLSGYVGDYYFEDGFTSSDVVLALAQVDDDVELDVYVNSPGGIASEGAAIHALFAARSGVTNITIEGIAASAASLLAMAGATVTMSAGAVMMIHDPQNITFGDSAAHAKTIEELEAFATAYSRVYATKSGKTPVECREIMKAETWFSPDDAVAAGFADATTQTKAKAVAAFDYRLYEHAPTSLKALASKKNWHLPGVSAPAASAAQPTQPGDEDPMGDKERADQLAAENAKLKEDLEKANGATASAVKADRERRAAIMALPEAKGREALAEHLFNKGDSVDDAKATLAAAPKAEGKPAPSDDDAATLEARRLNGEGLNGNGGKPSAMGDRSVLASAVERTNKRR